MKIYVCSSWRNGHYPHVISAMKALNLEVWDWRNPPTGGNGFRWQDCGRFGYVMGEKWSSDEWNETLQHPIAQAGFASDLAGMNWCDVGVLLHPCGRSAHLEAGWLAGRGKTVHILALEPVEPDLMVLALNGKIFDSTVLLNDYLFAQSNR